MPDQAYKSDLSSNELNALKQRLAVAQKQLEQGYDVLYDAVISQFFAGEQLSSEQQKIIKLRIDQFVQHAKKEEADLYKEWHALHEAFHRNQVDKQNLHDQPRLRSEQEQIVKRQVDNNIILDRGVQVSALREQISELEAQIDVGKPLKEKIVDFNKAIFAYEDGLIIIANSELGKIAALQQDIPFNFPINFPKNKDLLDRCIAGIQHAESLQEMEFYRGSFVRALENIDLITDLHLNLRLNEFVDHFKKHENDLDAKKELKKGIDDFINQRSKIYADRIQKNNQKIKDIFNLLNLPSLQKDQRADLEEELRKNLAQNRQYNFALQQIHQIKNDIEKIVNAKNADEMNQAIDLLNAHQEQVKQYNDAIYRYKKSIACLCIARSSYLKPGYSLWESLTEADQRKEAYVQFLKSFMEKSNVEKIQKLADQQSSGTSEAVVEFVTDDVKNIAEVVTALPVGVNQAFNIGTFAFDMVNIGAELTEAQGHYAVPVKLGERHPEPVTGWNIGGRLLSLGFGLAGLAASVVLFLGSILPGVTSFAAANVFSLSLVALIDTFWGAGNYTLDKIKEWKHNKKVQEGVADLEVLDSENLSGMLASHNQSLKVSPAAAQPGQQPLAEFKPKDGSEARVFDLLNAVPAAPPSSPSAQSSGPSDGLRAASSSPASATSSSSNSDASDRSSPHSRSTPSSSR